MMTTTTARAPERTDFLACVLVTAVEGGINNWADCRSYHWKDDPTGNMTDAHVDVREHDNPASPQWRRVTLSTIARGIRLIKAGKVQVNPSIKGAILLGDAENDAGIIDSDAADCIVQAALFGEVVYD